MALTIKLYNNSAEPNRVDKTDYLTNETTMSNAEFFDAPQPMKNPSIIVSYSSYPSFNYCYISDFCRDYFVTDRTWLGGDLWRLDLDEDHLYSFRNEISQLSAYVSRNEYEYTENVDDALYGAKSKPTITRIDPSSGGSGWYGSSSISSSDTHYRYCMQGGFQLSDNREQPPEILKHEYSLPTLTMDGKHFQDICSSIENSTSWFGSKTIQDVLVRSYALPVEPHVSSRTVTNIIPPGGGGGFAFLDTPQKMADQQYKNITWEFTINKFTGENAYKNYAPHRYFKLRFLPFGELTLDYSLLNGAQTLYLMARVNCYNGDVQLWYGNDSNVKNYLTSAQCGVDLPFTASNVDIGKAGVGALTSALAIAGGAAMGPVAGAAAVIGASASTISSLIPSTQVKQGTYNYVDDAPQLIIIDVEPVDKAPSLYGKPLNQYRALSSMHGYTVVDRVHVEGITTATKEECTTIESLLKSGVIFSPPSTT